MKYNQEKLRLFKYNGYWSDIIIGGILTSVFFISVGGFLLYKLNVCFFRLITTTTITI